MPGRVRVKDARQWALNTSSVVDEIQHEGARTLQQVADALNARRVLTFRGGAWSALQVWRLLWQAVEDEPPEGR